MENRIIIENTWTSRHPPNADRISLHSQLSPAVSFSSLKANLTAQNQNWMSFMVWKMFMFVVLVYFDAQYVFGVRSYVTWRFGTKTTRFRFRFIIWCELKFWWCLFSTIGTWWDVCRVSWAAKSLSEDLSCVRDIQSLSSSSYKPQARGIFANIELSFHKI